MLEQISSRQFAEWRAFYAIDPWGERRSDLRAGIVASTIANVHRPKGKPGFKPEDFMPARESERKQRMSNELMTVLKSYGKRNQ